MKHQKIWITITFLAVLVCGILIAFSEEQFQVTPVEPSQVENCPYCSQYSQPPENATVIPELETTLFDLSLDTREIILSRGESLNITVTLYSPQKVNLSLTVGTADFIPDPALVGLQPELPSGIVVVLDRTEIHMEAGSTVTANLTFSIGSEATSGTYTLKIFAVQKTSYGGHAVGVPLQLTIP